MTRCIRGFSDTDQGTWSGCRNSWFERGMRNVLYISDRYSGSRKKYYGKSYVRKAETACYFKGYHKRIAV